MGSHSPSASSDSEPSARDAQSTPYVLSLGPRKDRSWRGSVQTLLLKAKEGIDTLRGAQIQQYAETVSAPRSSNH